VDILVGNAAVFGGTRSRLADVDWDAWSAALEVNVLGNVRVALRLWPDVAASRERKIVFVSSRAGLPREAAPNRSYIYSSSKAALNSAVRCFALDLAPEGVITALVNPGHVQTRIGGARAPMTPAESVTKVRAVIESLTAADAGKFLHFDGTELKL
jgi:NAD(P)-dependent dehydrogenase (short-subunit alcohol dehydrogenase family)